MNNKDLQYCYSVANKLYFGNKLPKNFPIKFVDLRRKHCLGRTFIIAKSLCPAFMHIDSRLKTMRAVAILTLLHEMIHVAFPKRRGHGYRFDKEMRRLAKNGAFNGLW